MNTLIDILLLFGFLYVIFLFKFPNIENTNYLYNKFLVFVLIFLFNFMVQFITKIISGCNILYDEIIGKSLEVALYGVIGYSIFVDLSIMNGTKTYIQSFGKSSYSLYLVAAIVVIAFIAMMKTFKLLLSTNEYVCRA